MYGARTSKTALLARLTEYLPPVEEGWFAIFGPAWVPCSSLHASGGYEQNLSREDPSLDPSERRAPSNRVVKTRHAKFMIQE